MLSVNAHQVVSLLFSIETQSILYPHFVLLRYQYVLSERTWIEYWPTSAECLSDEHRPTCLGLEEIVTQYQLFGCVV